MFLRFRLLIRVRGDLCFLALMDRKQELRRLLATVNPSIRMMYVDHVEGAGKAPLERVCKFDRRDRR